MTPAFKHRLLGTAILLTAAIIFLPDLLDGEKQIIKDDFKVIPERPEFKGVQQAPVFDKEPVEQVIVELAATVVNESALDEPGLAPETVSSEPEHVQAATQSASISTVSRKANPALTDIAWAVRVGSFSKMQNANALVAKLRNAGFVTFTRDVVNTNGVKLTSVLVGPEIKKDKLEQQLPKLQQLTGIDGLAIISYQPTENN